jgi:ornithine carbamoyltransferase
MLGSAILGMNVNIATPTGYEPDATIMQKTKDLAAASGATVFTTTVAADAAKGADVIVTDTWVSMGQEEEYKKRVAEFDGYEVNSVLMSKANAGAVFLHCLPRHPEEVTDEVFYSEQSLVFPEAENRMVRCSFQHLITALSPIILTLSFPNSGPSCRRWQLSLERLNRRSNTSLYISWWNKLALPKLLLVSTCRTRHPLG